MTPSLDEQLTAALNAEADRSPESGPSWPVVEQRIARTRRHRRTAVAATAAVACLAVGLFTVTSPLDRDDADLEIRDEPNTVPTTIVPDDPSDPIAAQPGPAPRHLRPPETLVAVNAAGRLVVVDTATGEELRELVSPDDVLDHYPGLGMADSFLQVELSPDGETVWFDTCCAAVDGAVYEVPVDGSGPPAQWARGYDPTFASSGGWIATVHGDLLDLNFPIGDWGRYWQDESLPGDLLEAAWSFDGTDVVVRMRGADGGVESGPLLVLDPSLMGGIEGADSVESDHQEPRVLPGETWKLPVFRRDGMLVAAYQAEDGQWYRTAIDVASGSTEPAEQSSLDGEPIDQDFDASGEWLLAVEREPGADAGTLRWFGPDGQTGTVPGEYFAATW